MNSRKRQRSFEDYPCTTVLTVGTKVVYAAAEVPHPIDEDRIKCYGTTKSLSRIPIFLTRERAIQIFVTYFILVHVLALSADAFSTTLSKTFSQRTRRSHQDVYQRSFSRTSLFAYRNKDKKSSSSPGEREPAAAFPNNNLPQHVAIICDGNSRWAKARGLPPAAGHAAGADRLVQVLETLQKTGVQYCTLFAFSTENWQRPKAEVADLMKVMEQTARRFRTQILSSKARVRVLGDLQDDRIPSSLRNVLTELENESSCRGIDEDDDNNGMRQTVCLAINYGGRQDILNAVKQLAKEAATSSDVAAINSLTEDDLSAYLGTQGIPDPDLLIRTSGEHRLSNFLLWNIAYAEIFFTDTLWPDFDADCIVEALSWYSQRQRRFGSRESVLNGTHQS